MLFYSFDSFYTPSSSGKGLTFPYLGIPPGPMLYPLPCLGTSSYRMFSAASQPLDPDGTIFRLRFTAMLWWLITFPVFGFFFCIIWSLMFHFEYTVATDCGVSAMLPSTGSEPGREMEIRAKSKSRQEGGGLERGKEIKGWWGASQSWGGWGEGLRK